MPQIEHICLKKSKIKPIARLTPESMDNGKNWFITDEYEHYIEYCPYCGVKL